MFKVAGEKCNKLTCRGVKGEWNNGLLDGLF